MADIKQAEADIKFSDYFLNMVPNCSETTIVTFKNCVSIQARQEQKTKTNRTGTNRRKNNSFRNVILLKSFHSMKNKQKQLCLILECYFNMRLS